jgi:hypothetical protein
MDVRVAFINIVLFTVISCFNPIESNAFPIDFILNGNVVDYTTKINDVIDGVFNFSDLNLM